MIGAKVIVVRGSASVSEDWGEFQFLTMPSPADRIMVVRDGAENYATVISVHHYPAPTGSSETPRAEIVAKWTGSGAKLR